MSRLPLAALALCLACGVAVPGGPVAPASVESAIVNGQPEAGFPAVGALVMDFPDYGYFGSFCTGTLIDPYWVLTAGHCVTAQQGGMPIYAPFTKFYVGPDARGGRYTGPSTGKMYQAEEFYPHPAYQPDGLTGVDDLGLILLAEPVTDVAPIPVNVRALRGADLMEALRYVGFGVSNGITESGGGVKRVTDLPLSYLGDKAYYADQDGTGTCFGDSGGPGLLEVAPGDWRVAGVVSAGASVANGQDPCATGTGIYMRVDAYASWIVETTGIALPACDGACVCAAACRPDGTCDNTACRTRTCSEELACLAGCPADDDGCVLDCRFVATDLAQLGLSKAWKCLEPACPAGTPDRLACATAACGAVLDACLADASPDASCSERAECGAACDPGDALCTDLCDRTASESARTALAAAAACLSQQCDAAADAAGRATVCARTTCREAVDACFPRPPCDPVGGTCLPDEACRTGADGSTACVISGGAAAGDACDPAAAAPCGDGLECASPAEGTAAACLPTCREDAPCAEGEVCTPAGAVGPGVCRCADVDLDGACASADCDDNDPAVGPSAAEACGNARDDDCDGATDEDCEVPAPPEEPGDGDGGGCAAGAGGSGGGLLIAGLALLGLRGIRRRAVVSA